MIPAPWAVAAVAFALAWTLLWAGRRVAPRLGLVADPERQRFYELRGARRPVIAGVAVGLGALLPAAAAVWSLGDDAVDPVYSASAMRAITFALLVAVVVLGQEALRRDRRRSDGYGVWLTVVTMALLAGAYGVTFDEVRVPGWGVVDLGLANVLLTTLWVVIVVALLELLDTIPRVSAAVVVLVTGGLWLASLDRGELLTPILAAAWTGAGLAAVPWTAGQRVLLGKTGNKVVGFLLATLTIVARRKMEAALLVGVPLVVLAGYAGYLFVSHFSRGMELGARRPPS